MRYVVYLPLILSVLFAVPSVASASAMLADRIDPRVVVRLLVVSMVLLAGSGVFSLGLLTAGGVARLVAGPGVTTGRHAVPGALVVGTVAASVLMVVLVRAVRCVVVGMSRRRSVHRALGAGHDELTLVEDDAVYAVATPGRRGARGRVVASRGLWAALEPDERAVVLAHERAHLDGRHHRLLMLAALAVAFDPLLAPMRRAVAYALERCADESAVGSTGDRAVAARAVGRAALAAHRRPPAPGALGGVGGIDSAFTLGVTTGPVPRRVAALLVSPDSCATAWTARLRHPGSVRRAGDLAVALVTAALIMGAVSVVVVAVLHAAVDLTDIHG